MDFYGNVFYMQVLVFVEQYYLEVEGVGSCRLALFTYWIYNTTIEVTFIKEIKIKDKQEVK